MVYVKTCQCGGTTGVLCRQVGEVEVGLFISVYRVPFESGKRSPTHNVSSGLR